MKRRTFRVCALTATVIFAACDSERAAAPPVITTPSFAKSGNIDTDSRAILVWADQVTLSDGITTVSAGIKGDGYDRYSTTAGTANEYQGQVCGVHGKIFNTSSLSGSGDLVFDPDFDAPGKSCNGVSRKLRFYLGDDSTAGAPTAIGTFTNVRRIWSLAPGASSTQPMRFNFVNQNGCETLDFNRFEIGGQGDSVSVTRLPDSYDLDENVIRNWRVQSTGDHRAMCMVSSKGKTVPSGVTKYLPFAFTVTEVKYPYLIEP